MSVSQMVFEKAGIIAGVILPFFNIPLIMKIVKRQSSEDISLSWALGVWVCILLMFPAGLQSEDVVFRVFNIFNVIFFSCVMFVTWKYRKARRS
jgi:uncharacterized protein with PQ loop repeat